MDLEAFYKSTYKSHVRKILRVVHKHDVAESIVQDAFLKALERKETYDPSRAPLRVWFNYILFSTLRQAQRDYARSPEFVPLEDGQMPSAYQIVMPEVLAVGIGPKIEEWRGSDSHKEVLYLYYTLGFTNKEVSMITGYSVSNVTTICNRFRNWVLETDQ